MKSLKQITKLEDDFSKWYTDVVINGKMADYGPVKGTMIMRTNGYELWSNIQKKLDFLIKGQGAKNVYLPLLIPESYITKEKDHIEGFAPELATITRVGEVKLDEPIVLRPTSEVLFANLFAKDINSYNDLPLIYNQWANIIRWEKNTRPFLRTTEFLWQEGHSCHESESEAIEYSENIIKMYSKFLEEYLAIPTIIGYKTDKEKFAGAETTFTIEAMMKDGKALQSGTSHYLGQNFANSFNINFTNKENKVSKPFQTSWGLSTRLIGAIIMTHGDNKGIIMPPKIAPYQIDIIKILANKNENVSVVANNLFSSLSSQYRVRIDRSKKSFGFKASESEIQGVPIRIEVGPRDIENNQIVLVRRDTGEKTTVDIKDVKNSVDDILKDIHSNLLKNAKNKLKNNFINVDNYSNLKEGIKEQKFVLVPFDGSAEDEEKIKIETNGGTTRCIPINWDVPNVEKPCFYTGKPTKRYVIFAKTY
ncbi:MAG: proline--tRNA ligase [Mycoplasma sp.]|nr:proline--tRNA ligase [Mycoplasma sp.]